MKTASVSIEASFDEVCQYILDNMDKEESLKMDLIADKIIREWEGRKRIPIVDLMKQEILDKIKQEISLEKIEEFYESNTKSYRQSD